LGNESSIVSDSIILEEVVRERLVKARDLPAVYLILKGVRHVFPHEAVYKSWGYPRDFSTVITISKAELDAYPEGDAVPFRDGSMFRGSRYSLYGFDKSAVFFVSDGKLRPIKSGEIYQALFNDPTWKLVTWVPDKLLEKFAYPLGAFIEKTDVHPNGTLVKYADSSAVYLLKDGKKKAFISWDVFVDNGYERRPIITIPKAETYGSAETIETLARGLRTPIIAAIVK